jgi:asparagine synthase (glutamine-hydrolysing)
MCGIVGVMQFGSGRAPLAERDIAWLRDRMAHRGPDGMGVWVAPDGQVGLGHRRLAIIDLTPSGIQPMSDASGRIWLTYNGEIYNHVELRRELEGLGHRFHSAGSDSEVIIYAYRQWGVDAVQRLRGMFAFALWDANLRRLWLVRDRIGIKPLYYTLQADRLLFASEIKALLADPDVPREVDEESLFQYLSFLTSPAPGTLFAKIRKLAGGSMLLVHGDGRVEERRYWDAVGAARPVAGTDHEIAAELLHLLRSSVRLHKVSDVPVGVFLSGGIDSSTIAALHGEGEASAVRAFTVGYDKDYDSYRSEITQARSVARFLGAELSEVRLSFSDLIDFLPEMVRLQDEPIADPVCVPLYYVAKLAREQGVTVCQVGEGSDELFFGYPNWHRALRLQHLNDLFPRLGPVKALGLAGLRAWGKERSQPYAWLDRARRGLPIFWGGAEAFNEAAKVRVLSPRLRKDFRDRSSWDAIAPIHKRYLANVERASALGWMSYLDLNLRLPELLLMRVDKMTMASSLEARVPFLDHEVVSFALGIADEVKLRNGVLKAVLKNAVRGLIPDSVIQRPKQGFGVPVHEWLLSGLPAETMAAVDEFITETDLFDRAAIKDLFARAKATGLQWCILNLSLWWREFIRPKAGVPASLSEAAMSNIPRVSPEVRLFANGFAANQTDGTGAASVG